MEAYQRMNTVHAFSTPYIYWIYDIWYMSLSHSPQQKDIPLASILHIPRGCWPSISSKPLTTDSDCLELHTVMAQTTFISDLLTKRQWPNNNLLNIILLQHVDICWLLFSPRIFGHLFGHIQTFGFFTQKDVLPVTPTKTWLGSPICWVCCLHPPGHHRRKMPAVEFGVWSLRLRFQQLKLVQNSFSGYFWIVYFMIGSQIKTYLFQLEVQLVNSTKSAHKNQTSWNKKSQ